MKYLIHFLILIFCISSCETKPGSDSQWISIFDGVTTDGWRGYNSNEMPPGWTAKDGMLMFDTELELEQNYIGGKDIIYGKQEFENFELYVEWKIPVGGNSGIFYHIKEGYGGPPEISPEYQLIDDINYAEIHDLKSYNQQFGSEEPSKLQDWQQTAADYAMHITNPDLKKLNPAGEWNSAKIIFTNEKVEHWLNGKMVLSFVPWSTEWYEKRNSGKWKNAPDYGKYKTGYIGFQDHGSSLWFRNIK
ncbi:MAG: DUF1080 domain-containing protein, partial [Flavobacteriaceae bacterium]|nr:DUF1080 domain-containing protein [Flavobacteriaceae bacterium]